MRSYTFILCAIASVFAGSAFAADLSPLGKWRTFDDETGKPKSIVEITEDNGVVSGKVIEIIFSKKGPNPVCEDCDGARKNQPITGMTIIWDMKKDGEVWDGGRILDPSDGNEYGCKLTPIENGSKLQVRGFKGFSLLGKTKVWERVTP
jgi:uncharacterized protein (DUF2147 family)